MTQTPETETKSTSKDIKASPDQKQIQIFNDEASGLVDQAKKMVVQDKDDYEAAQVTRNAINAGVKERKDWVKPKKDTARQGWQNWVDLEKALCANAEKAAAIIGVKMSSWFKKEKKKAEEKEAALKAKAVEQNMEPELVHVSAPSVKGQRRVYKYKVVDFAKLSDEYKVEDSTKLGALARSSQAKAKVAGVEFKADTTTTG